MKYSFLLVSLAVHSAAVSSFTWSGLGTSCVVFASSSSSSSSSSPSEATATNGNSSDSSALKCSPEEAKSILTQAQALRAEADALRKALDEQAEARRAGELARIDKWIDDL